MKHEVVIRQQQPVSFFGAFFCFILLCMIWKWVLLVISVIAALVIAYWLTRAVRDDLREQAALKEELKQRADRQLNWYMSGDPRGIYGEEYGNGEEAGQ